MQTPFTPNHLKRWTRPDCYAGSEWHDYFSAGVGLSRDSSALERANFDAMLAALKKVQEPTDWPHDFAAFQVVRESHWAVGWVEWIAIHQSHSAALQAADSIMQKFQDYPVIDESLFSQYENEEANEVWKSCFNPRERLAYIRNHRCQFEFQNFQDLISCVRGSHFAGYASELLT